MDIAIVGLPLSGKTTTFAALAAGHAGDTASRGENIAVIKVSDPRLHQLAALVKAKKITPVEVRLHDLPPIFERGAPSGDTATTLARADALLHVVRAFHRDDVPHVKITIDPRRDIVEFDAELILNDLAIIERRLERLDAQVRTGRPEEREAGEREKVLLQRIHESLDAGRPLRRDVFSPEEMKSLGNYGLLSLKPALILLNIDEAEAANAMRTEGEFAGYRGQGTEVAAMCSRLEAELASMPPEEASEFRRELEAGDSPTERIVRLMQDVLGLAVFFTAGDETKAWTVPAGATALQAAGRIHSDIEKGFIRAEVISWDRLIEMGSHAEARKHGALRSEGKQYVVQDGDVLNILFHV